MLSRTAQRVLLDASPLCRFAECSLLGALRAYLGSRARITREVERELLRLADRAPFVSLAAHLRPQGSEAGEGTWPKTTKPLPDGLKADFTNLLALKHSLGEHDWAHAGEIATVLMAEHRRADLVMIDDGWGASLARGRGLRVMSTARSFWRWSWQTRSAGTTAFWSSTPLLPTVSAEFALKRVSPTFVAVQADAGLLRN